MSWELKKLDEIVLVKSGKRLPKGHSFIIKPTNHPYIRARDIKNGKINVEAPVYINDDTFNKISKYTVSENDVVITIVGANVGDIAIIDAKYSGANLTENAAKLIPKNNNELSPKFLKYSLFGDTQKSKFQQIAMAAAQPKLGFYKIKDFEINVPNIQTQKRIANILSAYDDLIQNNLKHIKLLEQAAQNIYKEWFVNLRFPGHENTPINQETGLPEGWEEKEISSIITFLGGYAFKSKTYIENGKYRVITIKNVGDKVFNTSVGNLVDSIPDKMKEHCKIIEEDILLSLTGNVGRSCIAYSENNLLNQRVAKIVPTNKNWLPYIYWMFNDNKMFSLMNNLATGVAQQNLSPVKLAKEKFVIPCESIIKLYCLKSNSAFKQIVLLNRQNQKLKAARDILLPRLMNRTIEV